MAGKLTIPPTEDAQGNKLNCEERFVGARATRTAEGTASLLGLTKDILLERRRFAEENAAAAAAAAKEEEDKKPSSSSPAAVTTSADAGNDDGTPTAGEDGEKKDEGGEGEDKDDESRLDWKPPYRKRIKLGNDQTLEMPYKYDFLKYDLNLPGLRELGLPEIMRNSAGHIDYRTISHQRVLTLFKLLHNSELAEIPSGEELAKKREEDMAYALANNGKRRKRKIEPEEPDGRRRLAGTSRGGRGAGGGGGRGGGRV